MTAEFCSITSRPILTAGLLRCDCGADVFAIAPGHDAYVALEHVPGRLFDDRPAAPMQAFCAPCWLARFGSAAAEFHQPQQELS